MPTWRLKPEPDRYGRDDPMQNGGTDCDGVSNHAAGHLRAMPIGDAPPFYHPGKDKAAVGVKRIIRAARADGGDGRVSVRVEPVRPLLPPVTLAAMKAEAALPDMEILRQSPLSVSDGAWAVVSGGRILVARDRSVFWGWRMPRFRSCHNRSVVTLAYRSTGSASTSITSRIWLRYAS